VAISFAHRLHTRVKWQAETKMNINSGGPSKLARKKKKKKKKYRNGSRAASVMSRCDKRKR